MAVVMRRRCLLLGLLVAPAVIRSPGLLMPISPVEPVLDDLAFFLRALNRAMAAARRSRLDIEALGRLA